MLPPSLAEALGLANTFNRGDGTQPARVPLVFTCDEWIRSCIPPVSLIINPHSISFSQNKRITKRNTSSGTVFFHWTDQYGQNNDILELQFNGRTGNINLKKDAQAVTSTAVGKALNWAASAITGDKSSTIPPQDVAGARKLYMWARLYELTRMRVLDPSNGLRNAATCVYRSPLFPQAIWFTGFFNNVLKFSEVAESPNVVDWNFTFVVQDTYPSLNDISIYTSKLLTNPQAVSQEIKKSIAMSNARIEASLSVAKNVMK